MPGGAPRTKKYGRPEAIGVTPGMASMARKASPNAPGISRTSARVMRFGLWALTPDTVTSSGSAGTGAGTFAPVLGAPPTPGPGAGLAEPGGFVPAARATPAAPGTLASRGWTGIDEAHLQADACRHGLPITLCGRKPPGRRRSQRRFRERRHAVQHAHVPRCAIDPDDQLDHAFVFTTRAGGILGGKFRQSARRQHARRTRGILRRGDGFGALRV